MTMAVCLKENNGEKNILFIKDTEELVLVQDLIKIIAKFRAEKVLCMFVKCTKTNILL